MTRTVYKYSVAMRDRICVNLPIGAEILTFQEQRGEAWIWALVDPKENRFDTRHFRFAGTGHPITDENLKYIGTSQFHGGSLVFHLFEVL